MSKYVIAAHIAADASETIGLSVYDWFRGAAYAGDILDAEYDSAAAAEAAARLAYRGPDSDGIECRWRIEEIA